MPPASFIITLLFSSEENAAITSDTLVCAKENKMSRTVQNNKNTKYTLATRSLSVEVDASEDVMVGSPPAATMRSLDKKSLLSNSKRAHFALHSV
jgi:hypothetical protein